MRLHFNVSLKENFIKKFIIFLCRDKKRSNFLVTLIEYRKRQKPKEQ